MKRKTNDGFPIILKCLITKNQMNQGDFAEAIGVSKATVSHYVNGQSFPHGKRLEKIAEVLNVSPGFFYENSDALTQAMNKENMFADNLNALMHKQEITQTELSNGTGISRQSICYYVNGKQLPSQDQMIKIAEFLNVSVDELTGKPEIEPLFQETKVVVTRMPETPMECPFRMPNENDILPGNIVVNTCRFGGVCDLENKECSKITMKR